MVLNNLLQLLSRKGYRLFSRDYELNVVGIRSANPTPTTFDDEFFVFWCEPAGENSQKRRWVIRHYAGTTDPGTYWLKNPRFSRGTAIVKEGQYLNCWAIGKHKGYYDALVQVGPITVLVDANRDGVLDLNSDQETSGTGINLHRAKLNGTSVEVGQWSAGCQVIASSADFAELMLLAKRHAQLYGRISYTLIDYRDYSQQQLREIVIGGLLVASALILVDSTWPKRLYHSFLNWFDND